jgi:hypothetical protein
LSRQTDKAEMHSGKDGQLKVYRRIDQETGKVGRLWYYNIAIRGQQQIRYRSTKTDDLPKAMTIADAQYTKVALRVASGINVSSMTFKKVAQEAILNYRRLQEVGDLKKERFERLRRTMENVYIPYFEDNLSKDFVEISALDIEDLILWRRTKGQMHKTKKINGRPLFLPHKPSAPTTINVELQMLRMVYSYAVKRKLILSGQVPRIQSIRSRAMDTRRPHFTQGEWARVTNYLHHHYLNEVPASVGNFTRLYDVAQHTYSYPPQETKLRAGKSPVIPTPDGFSSVTVEGIDREARLITLKIGAARKDLLADRLTLHPEKPLSTDVIAQAGLGRRHHRSMRAY